MTVYCRFLSFTFLCFIFQVTTISAWTLEVDFRKINSDGGDMLVAVYSSPVGFPADAAKAVRSGKAIRKGSAAYIRFDDLPAGTYAVAVIHDANSNAKLDTNFLGIPKEGYGVSNNAINRFGPPHFQDCAVKLDHSTRISIDLSY